MDNIERSEYPLFPELPEAAGDESQDLINKFKDELKKAAEDVIGDLYTDVVMYIESDSWNNFRNQLMEGFKDYNNRKVQGEFNFKEIREAIYKEYRDDIIKDLDQDNLDEIKSLQSEIDMLRSYRNMG